MLPLTLLRSLVSPSVTTNPCHVPSTNLEAIGHSPAQFDPKVKLLISIETQWIFEGHWITFPMVRLVCDSDLPRGRTIRLRSKLDLEPTGRSRALFDLSQLFSSIEAKWIFEGHWIPFPTVHPVRNSDFPCAILTFHADERSVWLREATERFPGPVDQIQLSKLGQTLLNVEIHLLTFPTVCPVRNSDQRFALGG